MDSRNTTPSKPNQSTLPESRICHQLNLSSIDFYCELDVIATFTMPVGTQLISFWYRCTARTEGVVNGFYPLLKWHPKHVTWVIFDTLNRDFCSCVRFQTLNKEEHVISSVILYPKQGSLFWYPKQGKSIGNLKSCCIIWPVRAHKRLKWERQKKGLMISPFIIKFTYLFDLPTLFVYLACQFCYPFSDFSCFWYPKQDTCVLCLTMKKYPFHTFLRSRMVYRSQWKWPPPPPRANVVPVNQVLICCQPLDQETRKS